MTAPGPKKGSGKSVGSLGSPALLCLILILAGIRPAAQVTDSIRVQEVRQIMEVLAGDSLEGRGNFQPGLLKAADFVGNGFRAAGLLPFPGHSSYFLPFRPAGGKKNERADLLDNIPRSQQVTDYLYLHPQPGAYDAKTAGYFSVLKVEEFNDSTFLYLDSDTTPLLVWSSSRLKGRKKLSGIPFRFDAAGLDREVLLMIADTIPASFLLHPNLAYYASLEYNVVGVLPGNSTESIMISSHYDHEGVIDGNWDDKIMNGANDNASGTTGVLTLAHAFAKGRKQERTIVFAAFAGEELGLTGSNHFIETETLSDLTAVVNLEMIGLPQVGRHKIFITGEYDSNLPSLLADQLKLAGLSVVRDPVPDKLLYERSDNYPFALHDIPAHTIMSSTDDDECYHQFCDELKRIDMGNLTAIINAIRVALQPFTDGTITKNSIR